MGTHPVTSPERRCLVSFTIPGLRPSSAARVLTLPPTVYLLCLRGSCVPLPTLDRPLLSQTPSHPWIHLPRSVPHWSRLTDTVGPGTPSTYPVFPRRCPRRPQGPGTVVPRWSTLPSTGPRSHPRRHRLVSHPPVGDVTLPRHPIRTRVHGRSPVVSGGRYPPDPTRSTRGEVSSPLPPSPSQSPSRDHCVVPPGRS